MSCLFEPIHGRFPTNSICDSYPDCVGCSYSDPFKQPKKTNADRIRNMEDEELARWIHQTRHNPLEDRNYREWLEWLKQEVSDDS